MIELDKKWESEAQMKGYANLVQWMKINEKKFEDAHSAIAAYFIQKTHESHEWWADTVGTQINSLNHQIMRLDQKISELSAKLEEKTKNLPRITSTF